MKSPLLSRRRNLFFTLTYHGGHAKAVSQFSSKEINHEMVVKQEG